MHLNKFTQNVGLTLPMNAKAKFICAKHKDTKIFENHINPVMLVFIGKLSL